MQLRSNPTKRSIAALFRPLRGTPLHPQWLVFRRDREHLRDLGQHISGAILDIGCADRRIAAALAPGVNYIGLDYPVTAINLYGTRPDVYGDAAQLPFKPDSFDAVTLLDVLEHLPDPESAISEAARVLKPGGALFVSVPFLYPLHDEPFDFQRWTRYGLSRILARHGLEVERLQAIGSPAETAALLTNIAVARTGLRLIQSRSPWVLPWALSATLLIPLRNLMALWLGYFGKPDEMMPMGYRLRCRKNGAGHGD